MSRNETNTVYLMELETALPSERLSTQELQHFGIDCVFELGKDEADHKPLRRNCE